MIDELVNNILNAEEAAENTLHGAAVKAAEISAQAEKEAAIILEDADRAIRTETEKLVAKTLAAADELFAEMTAEGAKRAEEAARCAEEKAKELSGEIARYILSGNC